MPITQDRMIAVLNAAQDYEQALDKAIGLIRKHATEAHEGILTWQEAMESTFMMVTVGGLLTRAKTTNKTLGAERQHFKAFARRNERSAQKMAEKRAEFGQPGHRKKQKLGVHQDYIEFVPERTTAPKDIQREGRLYGSLLDDVDAIQSEKYRTPAKSFVRPEDNAKAQGLEKRPGTLAPEIMAEIEREAEMAVKSHPGTVGTEATEALSAVDFEDEADEGTELDPKMRTEEAGDSD